MLALYFLVCFKIHTNYKPKQINPRNADHPLFAQPNKEACGPISFTGKDDWAILDSTDLPDENDPYFMRCTTPGSNIVLSGSNFNRMRTGPQVDLLVHGLFDIRDSNFQCTLAEINASGSNSRKVQLFHFQGTGTHVFQFTTFKFCGVFPYHYVLENNQLPSDWDPSLIVIEGSSDNSFTGGGFTHPNDVPSPQGWELINVRCIKCTGGCSLNASQLTFYNATSQNRGAFIFLETSKDINIQMCKFTECYDLSLWPAHAITIQQRSTAVVTIIDCNFTDCGKRKFQDQKVQGPTILADASGLVFERNIVQFTNSNNNTMCVRCYRKGSYIFRGNKFMNSFSIDPYKSSAIHYDGEEDGNEKPEHFELSGNTFDKIEGDNQGRCIYAIFKEDGFTYVDNNFVLNCPAGGFCVKFCFRQTITNFTMSGWQFKNNVGGSQSHGGGTGIWIENTNHNDVYTDPFNLIINECHFINNSCTRRGGALQIGHNDNDDLDKYQMRVEIQISNCIFTDNTAEQQGGAVAIATTFPLSISRCTFTNNKSPENGGAIYIKTDINDHSGENRQMPNATISHCQFTGNSGYYAHCIYIADGPNTLIEITNCDFTNNYNPELSAGACILSNAISLTIREDNFINDNIDTGSGGVNVTSRSTLMVTNSKFIHCNAGNLEKAYGGGIGYCTERSNDASRDESITIDDCTFDGNGGKNGVAIGLKPQAAYPTISNLVIKNHELTSWIFFIFFYFETSGDFELNSIEFNRNSYDSGSNAEFGGGTGIWIAESEDIDYTDSFNLVFNNCQFYNNNSPENGGALSYGGSPRLESVEITMIDCRFEHNSCNQYYGGACRFETTEPITLINCFFNDNSANLQSSTGGSGGGAIFIGATVKSVHISGCTFEDCFAYRGSFIFTNGAMKNINISKCSFANLKEDRSTSVYIEIDQHVTQFAFDSNTFTGLECVGPNGGAGLYVSNGADCEITNCIFTNCVGKGNGNENGVIRIPDESISQLIFTLCEFNNEQNSGEASARAVYIVKNSLVKFNSCKFLGYTQADRIGAILYSLARTSTSFYNCSFAALKGQSLMYMPNAVDVDVSDCQFTNCEMGTMLIQAESAENFTLYNCIFIKNTNTFKVYGRAITSLIFNNTFTECVMNSNSGTICIQSSTVNCEIFQNKFTKCRSLEGSAINIEAGNTINIHDCNFTDNSNDQSDCYVIYSKASNLEFSDSKIEYSTGVYGSGIRMDAPCTSTITNVQFLRLHRPTAIYYDPIGTTESEIETVVSNCLFDRIQMIGGNVANSYSVFRFGNNLNVIFTNNTIQNHELPEENWDNLLIGVTENSISNCQFINNVANGQRGGGSGIHFTGTNVRITDCYFDNNHANMSVNYQSNGSNGRGGALQFSLSTSIEIDGCTFINNIADFEGGGLSIQSSSSLIHNCTFTGNSGGRQNFGNSQSNYKMGGAIFYEHGSGVTAGNYLLQNCVIKSNLADSNGHGICIHGSSTKVFISDLCYFEDNSRSEGSQIVVNENAELDFSNSTVRLSDKATIMTRGIELFTGRINIHQTTFTHIQASTTFSGKTDGNAILVNRGNNEADIEDNLFKDCYMSNQLSYVVTFNGSVLNFRSNTFDFSPNKGCGCLRVYTVGQIVIEENKFLNVNTPRSFMGAIEYTEEYRVTNNAHTVIRYNIFENCTSVQTACFNFQWRSDDYEFVDNYFQNNDLKNYLGIFDFLGEKINGTFTLGRNHFINNSARSYFGGGTGLWFQNKPGPNDYLIDNHFTIFIDGCQFIGNHAIYVPGSAGRNDENGNGGALQLGWSESMSNIDVAFTNTTFQNNIADRQGGAISLQIIGYVSISNCTFEGNKGGQGANCPIDRQFGGAVYIWPDFNWAKGHYSENGSPWIYSENITITDCTFINNRALDATAVYVRSAKQTDLFITDTKFTDNYNTNNYNFTIVTEAREFVFDHSHIHFTNRQQASSGIRTKSITTISNSHFLKNCVHDDSIGEALLVHQETELINISDTIFEDCGYDNQRYNVIKLFSPIVNIQRSTFNFTSNTAEHSCRPIYVSRFCDFYFYQNRITNSLCNGAIHYLPTSGNSNDENIVIEKNIFEKLQGDNSRALYIALQTTNVIFYNNTIQDCPLGSYLFVFQLARNCDEFVIDSIIFRNLDTKSPFGGGCGAWIQLSGKKYNLIFRECIFENDYAHHTGTLRETDNGKGGALQYGWTSSISNVDLTLERCTFINNQADEDGGALCLQIQGNIEINECKFINNTAGIETAEQYCGGAIAIFPNYGYQQDTSSDSVNIIGCTFKDNLGHEGNAIFVQDGPETDIIISGNCQFIDNTRELSRHACVQVEARKLEVDDSTFEFTFLNKSCIGIRSSATALSLDGVNFHRCVTSSLTGSALILSHFTETATVYNCKFVDNGNNNFGAVIHNEATSLEYVNNTIDFTDFDVSDRAIHIPFICQFRIADSTFHHCRYDRTGAGATIDYLGARRTGQKESIIIENTIFNNNSCTYASCLYMKPLSTIPVMRGLTVKNHQREGNFVFVVIFQANLREDINVEKCTFENNLYYRSRQGKLADCGGSGLWIACANYSAGYRDSYRLIFNQCKFLKNRNNLCGGALAYGYSDTLRYIFLDFIGCSFEDNTCDGEIGGALSFNGNVPVTIQKSTFKGNKAMSGTLRGHCIYVDKRAKVQISDTVFIDNGLYDSINAQDPRTASGFSIIQCSGVQLDLNNCTMTFTNPNITNSRFIDIDYYSVVNLINSTFSNCSAGDLWGGALHLNKDLTSIIDEQITIDSCVFDNNDAGNGCSALLNTTGVPVINNLTFRNQKKNKFIFAIFFVQFRDACTIENTVFENSTASTEDGGGSAIWIANQEEISHGRPFELTFSKCTWRNNAATERGGAIHYGNSKTLIGVQLTFEGCHFIGNHARKEGGAVSLVTKSPIVFVDCEFRGNYVEAATRAGSTTAGTRGGSISVNSKTPLVSITRCSFTNETSDQGNAIFIHPNVQACLISTCTFKNCGKTGTCIVSETQEFSLSNSDVTFDRRLQSCRALEILTIAFTRISKCTFRNCYSTDVGAGIYLNNTLQSEEQEDFTLEDTIFDSCEAGTDGCAFYLNVSSSPVIRGLTIQNHRFDKNISVIMNYYDFQDLYSIFDCKFINNQFQNTLGQDGGGSAIFIANGIHSEYESSYKISFIGCTWSKNSAGYGGAFSSGQHNLHSDTELSFERCTFTDNIATHDDGGALYLKTKQLIFFDDCVFNKNKCHNPEASQNKLGGAIYIIECSNLVITRTTFFENSAYNGNAIWIEDIPTAEITDCTFNSNNEGKVGSQIAAKCAQLTVRDSIIEFNPKRATARGVQITQLCQSSFYNCQFLYCNISAPGGGIYITNENSALNRTESFTIDGCLFDKCDSSNGCALQATISCNPTIRKCTVSNCDRGNYILVIFFNALQQFVTVDECTFLGNYFAGTSTSDAGGIGLWIAHETGLSADSLSLTFSHCNFISNRAGKNGGALAYGESPRLKNISLTFRDCTFNDNTCNGGQGGALYISIERQMTVVDCHFINNKCNGANTKGSAIWINSPSDLVSIRDSTFEGGQAIDGAIYSGSNTNNLAISNTVFTNCASSSTGSSIYSQAGTFSLQSSRIIFDDDAQIKCRGLFLKDKADATLSDVTFINCQSSGEGGGLNVDFRSGNREIESLSLLSVTIERADATNGCGMFIQTNICPTFDRVAIRNSTSGRYVMTVIFATFVPEARVTGCNFEYNEFANNAYPPLPDAGGSGVWVANAGKAYDDREKALIFEDCVWLQNRVKDTSSLKYGGGFAIGTSPTTKITEVTFNRCRFVKNFAQERGGGLYLATTLPVTIEYCLFDGNEADEGSSIYSETTSNVTIRYTQIVRGKTSTTGAAYIKSNENLEMLNVTFTENAGGSPASLYLANEGKAIIENCNFDYSRTSDQHQIHLHGESSSATITFRMGCFTHQGENGGNAHIYSTHKGTIELPAGNCFDAPQNIAISNNGGSINAGSGVFDCNKCGSIYVPTIAPEPTPTASASQSLEVTTSQEPTSYVPTPAPTPVPVTSSASSSSSSGESSSGKKNNKKMKQIAMIAGITAAIVIVIVIVIILLWLFIFRKRKNEQNSDQNASEMNDEQITEITGITPNNNEDFGWTGAGGDDNDNPLFDDAAGDDNDGNMINNDFEESWGNVI